MPCPEYATEGEPASRLDRELVAIELGPDRVDEPGPDGVGAVLLERVAEADDEPAAGDAGEPVAVDEVEGEAFGESVGRVHKHTMRRWPSRCWARGMQNSIATGGRRMTKKKTEKRSAGITELGALRRFDPEKYERKIRDAMKKAEGDVHVAAEMLGVASQTLFQHLHDERFADVARKPKGRPWPK